MPCWLQPGISESRRNRAARTFDGIAGKAINAAKVLKTLGEEPIATGFLGGARGEEIQRSLREREIGQEFIWVPVNTRQCVTVIDERTRTQTELVEESQPLPSGKYDELLAAVERRLSSCRAIIMSGTLTPGGPADF